MKVYLLALSSIAVCHAFTVPTSFHLITHRNTVPSNLILSSPLLAIPFASEEQETDLDTNPSNSPFIPNPHEISHEEPSASSSYAPYLTAFALLASLPSDAFAAGPDWGIFEGRIGSLLHPLFMGGLFLLSLSTGIKGLQYKRQRTIGDDISALKKTLPDLRGATSVREALRLASQPSSEAIDSNYLQTLKNAIPIEEQVDALIQERKDLSSKGLRDAHFSQGALLAFLGTAFAIEGPLNTYARAGKLFPGPHLYAGAGLVVLWAAAAACVPAMQKGNDTARSIHIAANVAGMGLFGWQVVTGLPILFKVIELTSWP